MLLPYVNTVGNHSGVVADVCNNRQVRSYAVASRLSVHFKICEVDKACQQPVPIFRTRRFQLDLKIRQLQPSNRKAFQWLNPF